MARDGQGYPRRRRDMMMMMIYKAETEKKHNIIISRVKSVHMSPV